MEPSTKIRVVEQQNTYAKNNDVKLALSRLPNTNKNEGIGVEAAGATDTQSKMASLTARYVHVRLIRNAPLLIFRYLCTYASLTDTYMYIRHKSLFFAKVSTGQEEFACFYLFLIEHLSPCACKCRSISERCCNIGHFQIEWRRQSHVGGSTISHQRALL